MLFQKKTVATVLAGFNKVIDDLEAVATVADNRQAAIKVEVAQLETEQEICRAECDRADAIRNNLMTLIGSGA